MGRKIRSKSSSTALEKQTLLRKDLSSKKSKQSVQETVVLTRRESKVITVAPHASDTEFGDVPVLTICPYCNQKVVTKTHFDKKKPMCFCCCVCHPTMNLIFKDVIHSCPKCNREITTYNRFLFCFRGFKAPKPQQDQQNNNNNNNNNNDDEYKRLKNSDSESQCELDSETDRKSSNDHTSDFSRKDITQECITEEEPIDGQKSPVENDGEPNAINNTTTTSEKDNRISNDNQSLENNNGSVAVNDVKNKSRKKNKRFSIGKKTKIDVSRFK